MKDAIFRYNAKKIKPDTKFDIHSVTHKTQIEFTNRLNAEKMFRVRSAARKRRTEGHR